MADKVRTDPFTFRGLVNEAGYEWLKDEDGKLRLVPRHVAGMGYRVDEPQPGLFLEFAKMSPTKESIEHFAEIHGDPFSSNRYQPTETIQRSDGSIVWGETFSAWKKTIEDMWILVGLWEDIKYRQISRLKKLIQWTDKSVGYILRTRGKHDRMIAHAGEPAFARFSPKDVLLPARYALQREINERLESRPPVPRLAWTPDNHQRIVISSPDLLAAMWLQFAYAVAEEFQLRECEECGKYFQVGPGGRRADSTTCSDACRVKKHRRGRK